MKHKILMTLVLLMTVASGAWAEEVTIGDPTSTPTNRYLPSYSLYDYSFTQQIYTADEIGMSGTIKTLTMWLNNTSSYARNFNVYMKEVSGSIFEANNSWVSLSADDLVGTATINNGVSNPTETRITLETPFEYSGTGNLLICIHDITGSWSSGLGGLVFETESNQSLEAHRDGTAYNISNPEVSGTLRNIKNVVRLNFDKRVIQNSWILPETIDDLPYTGEGLEPAVTVKDGETTLTEGVDYTVAYSNNVQGGSKGVVTITGIGNYSGTATKNFNVVAAVYSTANAAIDVNVPEGLGQLTQETTGQTTDLYYFLQSYLQNSPNPAYIKLRLASMGQYVISQPLTVSSAITIEGDAEAIATIDATALSKNPFVRIDNNYTSGMLNEKGFCTNMYDVTFKNFIVEKAKGSLFSSNGQKYDIPYMTIDNVVYEAVNNVPLISLDGGIVENLTMTRSTAFTFGKLYNGSGSATLAEAGVNSQKFTFSYNTLVGTPGLVHADDSESAKRTINVDHNVIIESTANFVTGLNAGDANCIVQYNAFLSTSGNSNANGDYVFNDISNTEDANGAAGSIKGNMVWVNINKLAEDLGDWVINFPMGDCPQRDAKIGDPRWLSAKMRVKEADVDDDNDLAKVINEGVKKGYTEFELVQNQYGNLRYTLKQSIVTDKAISITGENVQIDVEHSDPFIQLSTTPAETAVNDYFRIDQMLLKGLEIKGIKNSIIYDNNTKYCVVDLTIDDCVLGLETEAVKNEALISFQAGGVKDFTIKNSTVYGNNAVAKYFIRYNNSARLDRYGFDKNTEFQTMTYQNNTFYGLLKSDGQWANYSGIAGQNYSKFVVEKNIWYNSSNEIIRRMAGGRFGGNAPRTFDKNTYFLNGADNSAKEAGYDQTGTALTTDPGFKDAANGDFTLSAYSAQLSEQTGDPRWFAEGGHYNPVTGIETVKTAEETSLENAVIYNLNGQRVEKAQKGINIVNGKKVIIK